MNWINISIFLILLAIVFYFIYLTIKYRLQRNKLFIVANNMNNELFLQNNKILELEKQIEQLNLKESDGFVKFLSASRDWAFEYIEEVQKVINEFDEEVAPILQWANTYGNLAGDTVHTETITKISEAYNKLKSVLPENTETPNN
jgi:hypothetical protein